MKDISEALAGIVQEKGISEELALQVIETTLLKAYKTMFGNEENAIVRFSDDKKGVSIYARKTAVDGVADPSCEIELQEAKELAPNTEIGDELMVELDPETFGRAAVSNARAIAKQTIREIRKDSLYAEYKDKEGDIIIGYYQRATPNGNIFVDLG
jgi:N utilization substance protein A